MRHSIVTSLLIFSLAANSAAIAAEQVGKGQWLWIHIDAAPNTGPEPDGWWKVEGMADVEIQNGKIKAELYDGKNDFYRLSGTMVSEKLLQKGLQKFTVHARMTTINSDAEMNVPYDGTYRKIFGDKNSDNPSFNRDVEVIVLSNDEGTVELLRSQKSKPTP